MKHARAEADRWFEVVLGNEEAQAAVMTLSPGQSTGGPENRHPDADQWLYVVSGEGHATVAGEAVSLAAGDLLLIESGEAHELTNSGSEPFETLNIYVPPTY